MSAWHGFGAHQQTDRIGRLPPTCSNSRCDEQQRDLHLGGQFADLVEEDRPALPARPLEAFGMHGPPRVGWFIRTGECQREVELMRPLS
jgi:hypothetical protein